MSQSSNVAGNPEEIFAAVVPLMLDAGTGSVVNVASITFLLSDDGTNVNGAILASDGGWSAL